MIYLLLGVIGLAVLVTIAFRLSMGSAGRIVARTIEAQHREAEYIVTTRKVPPAWSERDRYRLGRASRRSHSGGKIELKKRRAKARYATRLARTIAYFRTSPTVADEGSREVLLGELIAVRDEWISGSWESVTAGTHE